MRARFRYYGAAVLAWLLVAFGFTRRAKRRALKGEYILSIFFHSPYRDLFEFCVKWLKKNGFVFLSPADIEDIKENLKPFPKGGVILTVDDGWESNEQNIVAVANQYKVPVTIFVSTEPVEKGVFWWSYVQRARQLKLTNIYKRSLKLIPNIQRKTIVEGLESFISLPREAMTTEQIRNISASEFVTIGSHTVTHPILLRCKDEESLEELTHSKMQLESWINKQVFTFAYPNGNYSSREVNILHETGYSSAFTTNPEYLTREKINDIYELPRFCIFEDTSRVETVCRMLGVWETFLEKANYNSGFNRLK